MGWLLPAKHCSAWSLVYLRCSRLCMYCDSPSLPVVSSMHLRMRQSAILDCFATVVRHFFPMGAFEAAWALSFKTGET